MAAAKNATASGMKIVSITWYKILPAIFGGQKGIACFNEYLGKHFPLVCLCSSNNGPADDLSYTLLPELPVTKGQFINPFCWKKISAVILAEKATHIILEHPYHGIAAYRAKQKSKALLILHSHNIESERFRQLGKWGWRILRSYEKWIHRKADLVLFKTKTDKEFAIANFGINEDNCLIIPYGITRPVVPDKIMAAQVIRQRHGIAAAQKILLFAGTLDYEPNAKAVEEIYAEIIPRLTNQYKVVICGKNNLSTYNHPDVIVTGEVKDMSEYFSAADVFINPVTSGGGIQTKNIEALAHDCNLVCFEKMMDEDTKKVAGGKIFMANDWNEFGLEIQEAIKVNNKIPDAFFEYYDLNEIVLRLADRIR